VNAKPHTHELNVRENHYHRRFDIEYGDQEMHVTRLAPKWFQRLRLNRKMKLIVLKHDKGSKSNVYDHALKLQKQYNEKLLVTPPLPEKTKATGGVLYGDGYSGGITMGYYNPRPQPRGDAWGSALLIPEQVVRID